MAGSRSATPRSLDMYLPLLPMLATGESTRIIARAHGLSYDNASWRISRVCWLLGAHNRTAAVSHAYRRRLLDVDTGELTHKAHSLIAANQASRDEQENTA